METKLIFIGLACLFAAGGAIFYFNGGGGQESIGPPTISRRAVWRLQEIEYDGDTPPTQYITNHTMYVDFDRGFFRHDEATYDADLESNWYDSSGGKYSTNVLNTQLLVDLGFDLTPPPESAGLLPISAWEQADECLFMDGAPITTNLQFDDLTLDSCDAETCTWRVLNGDYHEFIYVEYRATANNPRRPKTLDGLEVLEYIDDIPASMGDVFALPPICDASHTLAKIVHMKPTPLNATEERWAEDGAPPFKPSPPTGGAEPFTPTTGRVYDHEEAPNHDLSQFSDDYKREPLGMDTPKIQGKHFSPQLRLGGTKWCGNNNEFTIPGEADCTGKAELGTLPGTGGTFDLFADAGDHWRKRVAGRDVSNLPYNLRNFYKTRDEMRFGHEVHIYPNSGPKGQRLQRCMAIDKVGNPPIDEPHGEGLAANAGTDDKICRMHDFCPHGWTKWAVVSMRKRAHPIKSCACDHQIVKHGGTYKAAVKLPFGKNNFLNPCKDLKLKCQGRNWIGRCTGGWKWMWGYVRTAKYNPGPNRGFKLFSRAGRQDFTSVVDPPVVAATYQLPLCAPLRNRQGTIGDGKCDAANNNEAHGYDGGDCCATTCNVGKDVWPPMEFNCGVEAPYDCQQPNCVPPAPTPAPPTDEPWDEQPTPPPKGPNIE